MTQTNLPKPLQCPDFWKYSKAWEARYDEKHGDDYLSEICKHREASFNIFYYICTYGEMALTKIKTQNLFIKRITAGTLDPTTIEDMDIDWQGGHTWVSLNESREELFELYNAHRCPADILAIIDEVKSFMIKGQLHCQSLLQYLAGARADLEQKKGMEREQERLREEQELLREEQELLREREQARSSKSDLIDEKHSRATEEFLYLLSNALMPGVYKIGFTADNPDKRAIEVSEHYGLPLPFEVIEYWQTKNPYITEKRVQTALACYLKGGEFFEVDLELAKQTIADCLEEENASDMLIKLIENYEKKN
jgi:hypothetical protein